MLRLHKTAVPLTLHLPPCPGDASAETTSNITTYRFQQGQTSSLFPQSPASPGFESRRLHNTDMSNAWEEPEAGSTRRSLESNNYLYHIRARAGLRTDPFHLTPTPHPKESLFLLLLLLLSKWTQLPVELTHFPETCNYTGCCVSALITLPVPHGNGSQAAPPSLPSPGDMLQSPAELPRLGGDGDG